MFGRSKLRGPPLVPALAAVGILAAAPAAEACNVPVFRYALERWPAEPYEAVLFHRGPLSPEDSALVSGLREASGGGPDAPFHVSTVDLAAGPDEEAAALWKAQQDARPPWLVLRYPPQYRIEGPAWAGPLGEEAVAALATSPARQALARRIARGGDSAVFVLLESGDPEADAAADRTLRRGLGRLQEQLELPSLETGQWDDPLYDAVGAPDLRLAFSVLRVARDDPAERVFVSMLLGTESDLREFDEPMVFPVYGRGRALYALVGKGINAETLGEACAFLIGPCSCIVKSLNPGTDLLVAADWDAALADQASAIPEVEPPPLEGFEAFDPAPAASEPVAAAPAGPGPMPVVLGIVLAVGVAGVAVASLVVWLRLRAARS